MVKTTPVSVKMGSVKVSVNGTDNWKTDPNHYCYYIILLLITLSDLAFYNFTIRLKASFYHNMDLRIIKKHKNLFLNYKISSFTFVSKLLTENYKTTNISNCLRTECFWWCNEFKLHWVQFFLYSISVFSWNVKYQCTSTLKKP